MFGKKKMSPSYDPAAQKPVLRCSICTGEQVAGFQDLHTGHFTLNRLVDACSRNILNILGCDMRNGTSQILFIHGSSHNNHLVK